METSDYLEILKGHILETTVCDVTDEQVIVEKPRKIELNILKSAESQKDKFEIEVVIPGGSVYTLSHHKTLEEAKTEYQKLIKAIEAGERKIKISMVDDFTVSVC